MAKTRVIIIRNVRKRTVNGTTLNGESLLLENIINFSALFVPRDVYVGKSIQIFFINSFERIVRVVFHFASKPYATRVISTVRVVWEGGGIRNEKKNRNRTYVVRRVAETDDNLLYVIQMTRVRARSREKTFTRRGEV